MQPLEFSISSFFGLKSYLLAHLERYSPWTIRNVKRNLSVKERGGRCDEQEIARRDLKGFMREKFVVSPQLLGGVHGGLAPANGGGVIALSYPCAPKANFDACVGQFVVLVVGNLEDAGKRILWLCGSGRLDADFRPQIAYGDSQGHGRR